MKIHERALNFKLPPNRRKILYRSFRWYAMAFHRVCRRDRKDCLDFINNYTQCEQTIIPSKKA